MRVTLTTTFGCYPLLNTTGSLPVHMLAVIRPSGVQCTGPPGSNTQNVATRRVTNGTFKAL